MAGESILLSANAPNFGSMFVILDPFDKRREPDRYDEAIAQRLQRLCYMKIPEAVVSVFGAPPVDGLGTAAGFKLMVEDRGNSGSRALQEATDALIEPGQPRSALRRSCSPSSARTRRNCTPTSTASRPSRWASASATFSTRSRSTWARCTSTTSTSSTARWQVKLQADGRFRRVAEQVGQLKVRNAAGQMVPLNTVTRLEDVNGPVMVTRYNMYPAAPINGNVAPGASSGQGIQVMEQLAAAELPRDNDHRMDRADANADHSQDRSIKDCAKPDDVFVLAVVLVFLVLAAQYESWSLPLAVILVVPMCLLCSMAGVALAADGREHLHADRLRRAGGPGQQERDSDRRVRPAAARVGRRPRARPRLEACRLRLAADHDDLAGLHSGRRAAGDGPRRRREMRRTLGTAVFSGMLGVTLFGIFLTPVFFYVIDRLTTRSETQARSSSCDAPHAERRTDN